MAKLARVLGEDFAGAYRRLVSQWDDPAALLRAGSEPNGPVFDESIAALVADPVERMQYLDTVTYLPDDILAKVDRASMAVALEVRVPIIDHRVVEFAWALPSRFRIRDGETKWLLRRVLDRYVPRDLVERPKMGFAIPLEAMAARSAARLGRGVARRAPPARGYFDPAPIRARWAEHPSGARNRQHAELWVILMFQAWLEAKLAGLSRRIVQPM
ncbi:MAG: asparagine synthase C-terminal domain-containing protein [Hyphomicrobiales bacterium]